MQYGWKKFAAVLLLIPCIAMGDEMKEREPSLVSNYLTGQKLGRCLVRGCSVFLATTIRVGKLVPEAGSDPARAVKSRTIDLKITEWLFGKPEQAGRETTLVQSERPAMTKTSLGPWSVWDGVNIEPGTQLLVARWSPDAQRPRWDGAPEEVALVLSGSDHLPSIRKIIQQHQSLIAQPDAIKNSVALLSEGTDSAFAGYLFAYLTEREITLDPDRAAVLVSGLIANASLPESGRMEMADWIVSTSYRFSDSARKTVVEKLSAMGTSRDETTYAIGITTLLKLQGIKMTAPQTLDRAAKLQLLQNYRSLVDEGKAPAGLGAQLATGDTP